MTRDKYDANSTLGWLYLSQADQLRKKASFYCKKALELRPNGKRDISIINAASGGIIYDWDVRNRQELIDYYRKTLLVAPENQRLYFYLLDNLIDDDRLTEARQILTASEINNPDPLNAFYKIFIKEKARGFKIVKTDYLTLTNSFQKTGESSLLSLMPFLKMPITRKLSPFGRRPFRRRLNRATPTFTNLSLNVTSDWATMRLLSKLTNKFSKF
ncbi:hypothetical protein ACERC8_05690 [Streptococcus sp. E29BA]|uniref:hypothetical protein n=1 Tax=Streptococcus sp. E29BA TaxID=3278716 RepID=UPI00359DE252